MRITLIGFLRAGKNAASFGGAEKSMIMLANALTELGNDIHLYSLMGNHIAYPLSEAVNFHYFPEPKKNKFLTHISILKNTKKAIKESKPDLVISFWLHPVIYGVNYAKRHKIKFVYTERNDPDKEYGTFIKFLRDINIRKLDGFVFQTQAAMDYFPKKTKKKSIVIHNPIYIKKDDYPLIKAPDKRIVSVGRLTSQKNHKLLIIAFSKLLDEFPDYKLDIYGEGELRKELELLIEEKKLTNKVNLKGTTKNIMDEINGASAFVLSSLYEGMPNALMEAMALGIPCISSDCPGAMELIDHGKNGLLFKVGNVDDLVEKMRLLLSDKRLASEIGTNGMNILETHSSDRVFNNWSNFLQNLICRNKD